MWQYNQTGQSNELMHYGVRGMRWGIRSAKRQQDYRSKVSDAYKRKGERLKAMYDAESKRQKNRADRIGQRIKDKEQTIKEYSSLSKKDKVKAKAFHFVGGSWAADRYVKALANSKNKKLSKTYKKQARNRAIAANALSVVGAVGIYFAAKAIGKHVAG